MAFVDRGLLVLLLLFACALLPTSVGAQDVLSFDRVGVPTLTVDVVPFEVDDGGVRSVSPEHRFRDGGGVAFEITASRGGYVRLALPDATAESGFRPLWPASPSGEPIAAGEPKRVPLKTEPPIVLTGDGPSELLVLFSLRPPEPGSPRKWLKQIGFRGAGLGDGAPEAPRGWRFSGTAADGETVSMEVTLHHGGGDE